MKQENHMEMIFEGIPLAERHSKTRDLLIRDLLTELRWSVEATDDGDTIPEPVTRQPSEIYKAGFIAGYKTRTRQIEENK